MCHLSMKLSDTLDQNPPCTFDKIREKPILSENHSYGLTLTAKVYCATVRGTRKYGIKVCGTRTRSQEPAVHGTPGTSSAQHPRNQ